MTSLLLAAALVTNSFTGITNMYYFKYPEILTNVSGAYFMTNCFSYVRPSKTVILNLNMTEIGCIDRINPNQWDSTVDPKTLELFTAATNLVMHTKLKPIITKTNDTYYIELKEK